MNQKLEWKNFSKEKPDHNLQTPFICVCLNEEKEVFSYEDIYEIYIGYFTSFGKFMRIDETGCFRSGITPDYWAKIFEEEPCPSQQ